MTIIGLTIIIVLFLLYSIYLKSINKKLDLENKKLTKSNSDLLLANNYLIQSNKDMIKNLKS